MWRRCRSQSVRRRTSRHAHVPPSRGHGARRDWHLRLGLVPSTEHPRNRRPAGDRGAGPFGRARVSRTRAEARRSRSRSRSRCGSWLEQTARKRLYDVTPTDVSSSPLRGRLLGRRGRRDARSLLTRGTDGSAEGTAVSVRVRAVSAHGRGHQSDVGSERTVGQYLCTSSVVSTATRMCSSLAGLVSGRGGGILRPTR